MELVQDLVDREALQLFPTSEDYDEFSINSYTSAGCKFKY